MSATGRFGRFDLQVRLVLLLLVVFLGVVALMNVFLLGWARDAIDAAARREGEAALRAVAPRIEAAVLEDPSRPPPSGFLRRLAGEAGFRSIEVVDPRSGLPPGTPGSGTVPPALLGLDPAARDGLGAGRPVWADLDDEVRITGARRLFQPLVATDGRLVAVVEAVRVQPNLARLDRWIGRLRTIQIGGVLVVAVVVVVFANWVSGPYRTLARVAGEAGVATEEALGAADPDRMAQAFRAMVDRLREQDRALGTAARGGEGLGDLVRFAAGPAAEMTTGVLVVDRRRRIAGVNPAAAGLLALDADRARGATLESVLPSIPGLARLVAACLEDGRPATREVLPVRWPGGASAHLGVTLSPSPGADGRPAGALILMTDLTEIRELQERARVRENLAAVGEVSAGIAHEVRNALGTILANARMIEKREDPLVRGPARAIVREVEETGKVVEEFLSYARPAPPRPTHFELRGVVVRAAAAAPDEVRVSVDGEFGPVHADEGLVARAFDNLVRNAADAAREAGTTLDVRIRGRRSGDGRSIQVEVEDDGPGLPVEDLERIFVPFWTSRAKGTGLGLASVRRTLSDLGGSIEAAAAPGGGALFRLRFPLSEAEAGAKRGQV